MQHTYENLTKSLLHPVPEKLSALIMHLCMSFINIYIIYGVMVYGGIIYLHIYVLPGNFIYLIFFVDTGHGAVFSLDFNFLLNPGIKKICENKKPNKKIKPSLNLIIRHKPDQ